MSEKHDARAALRNRESTVQRDFACLNGDVRRANLTNVGD
jgi:hypothetical protein